MCPVQLQKTWHASPLLLFDDRLFAAPIASRQRCAPETQHVITALTLEHRCRRMRCSDMLLWVARLFRIFSERHEVLRGTQARKWYSPHLCQGPSHDGFGDATPLPRAQGDAGFVGHLS